MEIMKNQQCATVIAALPITIHNNITKKHKSMRCAAECRCLCSGTIESLRNQAAAQLYSEYCHSE